MDVELVESVERHKHKHEVFLSFNNDSDTQWFEEWWLSQGQVAYEAYVEQLKG